MSALGFDPSLNYSEIDLSVPVMIQPYRLIVPWPDKESCLLAPLRPFQPVSLYSFGKLKRYNKSNLKRWNLLKKGFASGSQYGAIFI